MAISKGLFVPENVAVIVSLVVSAFVIRAEKMVTRSYWPLVAPLLMSASGVADHVLPLESVIVHVPVTVADVLPPETTTIRVFPTGTAAVAVPLRLESPEALLFPTVTTIAGVVLATT